ncbi:hypothetical protein AN960_16180 [Bacillus sp. FJAT-25509]|uniref:hypothetical protein n=1 Tax=Bacillus sp. FJAT-25509 TaxID=1712029 RepID=UPI0006F9A083|nr:hypothetical protein [Bacillus sp. FJAT-25509]KQL37794.1 hypothetical protein AN960_16180 [Bacillus sp. FJAT-25509]
MNYSESTEYYVRVAGVYEDGATPISYAASAIFPIEAPPFLKELSEEELNLLTVDLQSLYIIENLKQETSEITTNGVKSKAALKVASMLIKSGDKTVDILDKMGLLDKAAAKSFKRVTSKSGNWVNSIASMGDSAAAYARTHLPEQLRKWGITNKGTREMIANAVSYAIKAADWIFL